MKLSVVIVNHNGAGCLANTLAAILRETETDPFEVLVVDSASSDGSWRIAEGIDPRVVVLRHAENIGFCRGCNEGARHARGEFVAFVNFDAAVEPEWDVALLREMDPTVSVVGGMLLTADGSEVEAIGLGVAPTMSTFGLSEGTPRNAVLSKTRDVPAVSGALMLVRRDEFLSIGGFNEDLWMYGDEIDLCLRMSGRTVVTPSSAIRHEMGHAAGPALSPLRVHWSSRNRLINAARHLPRRQLATAVATSALYDVVTVVTHPRRDIVRAAVSGWASGISAMPGERSVRSPEDRVEAARQLTGLRDAMQQFRSVRLRRQRISGSTS